MPVDGTHANGASRGLKIVVAGAGIAGLATALFCRRAGFGVQVFEQAKEIRALGVGINLLPHALRELEKVGILDEVAGAGVQTERLGYFNKFGQKIWDEPRGRAAGYNWPQVSIHRGTLQSILLETAVERIGDETVKAGFGLRGFETRGDTAVAQFENRATGSIQSVSGDALVAADGIHSAARSALFPDEGDPKYSGVMLWRGASLAKPFLGGRTMIMAGHRDQKFVAYPIENPRPNGLQLINWVADLRRDKTLGREDWNRRGDVEDLLPYFGDWRFDWLDVPRLITSAEGIFEFPMVDRDPLPRWSHERMTLVGDAAHPMYPVGSNGATQAIRDASALADALSAEENVARALQRYEAARRPATARIVASNRSQGPEAVMTLAETRAPEGFADIETVIPRRELEEIANRYKTLAGFQVEALNAGGSVLDEV